MKAVYLLMPLTLSATSLAASKAELTSDIKSCFSATVVESESSRHLSLKKVGSCNCSKIGMVAVNDAMQQGPYFSETPPLFKGYTRNLSYPIIDPGFKNENLTIKINCLSTEMPSF